MLALVALALLWLMETAWLSCLISHQGVARPIQCGHREIANAAVRFAREPYLSRRRRGRYPP
jgi:hypothetical protein